MPPAACARDDVSYMEVDPEGKLVREKWFKVPYYCMMHDFGITEDYLVLHIVPSTSSWEWLEQKREHFAFDTTKPVYLGIIPRRDDLKDEDIRWFKRDNCFASHVVNAWQEGTKVHFVIPEAKNNMFPFFPDIHGAPFNGAEAMSKLTRWTVDMASNGDEFDEIEQLTDTASEFPRIDDRFTGVKNRYTWGLEMDMSRPNELKGGSAGGFLMNCLFLKDLETGEEKHWWCGPVSELAGTLLHPAHARTRRRATAGSSCCATGCENRNTDLLIFDALDIEKGPVATVHIPIRLRFGLHGNFARSEDIGLAKAERTGKRIALASRRDRAR